MPTKYKPRPVRPLADRLWEKVDRPASPDDCWLWTGATTNAGYGKLHRGRRDEGFVLATHAVWEIEHGAVPAGMKLCHTCDTPRCCNPRHLFLGTQANNVHDMIAKGRFARGEAMTGAKVSEAQVREIRQRHATENVTQVALAAEYGVSFGTIHKIVRRKRWAHVA